MMLLLSYNELGGHNAALGDEETLYVEEKARHLADPKDTSEKLGDGGVQISLFLRWEGVLSVALLMWRRSEFAGEEETALVP
jgi:hypothetical protein